MANNLTKPTIETILERMSGMEERLRNRIDALQTQVKGLEERLETRLDRIESVANITRGEMLELRVEFREFRTQVKEHFPVLR